MSIRTHALRASALAALLSSSSLALAEAAPPAPAVEAAPPAPAAEAARPPPAAEPGPPVVIYSSAGVGSVLAAPHGPAPSAEGTLRANLPFGRFLALELFLSAGYAVLSDEPNSFWGRIGVGLRAGKTGPGISPYGAFRLVHMHYAAADVWWEHPGSSILGSSADGLQHSSGMCAAFGITWPLFPKLLGAHVRGMAELEGSWIPVGNAPPWFATAEAGLGYAF